MNGIHDLGGMHGFGAVIAEKNEPVFHSRWEGRMFAIASAIAYPLRTNDDQFRREIERIPPSKYLTSSYYELWFFGVLALLQERNVADLGEIDRHAPGVPAATLVEGAVAAKDVSGVILAGASTRVEKAEVARGFAVGDTIRVKNNHPYRHHRAPRYVRGRVGRIVIDHGVFSFNDSNSEYQGHQGQHCYAVEFPSAELWGNDGDETSSVTIDLFETYLVRA